MANSSKNKTPAKVVPAAAPVSRLQRSLMYMTGSVLGFGIIAIVALLIGEGTLTPKAFEGSQLWAIIATIPEIAIPLGFVLMIALLVITFRKRAQAAQGANK